MRIETEKSHPTSNISYPTSHLSHLNSLLFFYEEPASNLQYTNPDERKV